jgi:hypothetical protein
MGFAQSQVEGNPSWKLSERLQRKQNESFQTRFLRRRWDLRSPTQWETRVGSPMAFFRENKTSPFRLVF